MRVFPRFALVLAAVLTCAPLAADVFRADCPLTLAGSSPAATSFALSPHGMFVSGTQVFALRGQTLSTFTVNDTGDLQLAREDFVGSMGGRDSAGAAAFNAGYLYVSSEAGLEVFDLRSVRAGGTAPAFVSRTANLHYRKMAANGKLLAALYPAGDLPCAANGTTCTNAIDIYDISSPVTPTRVATISSATTTASPMGFTDLAFNSGYLVASALGGTYSFSLSSPAVPLLVGAAGPGSFLVSNGSDLLGVGNDTSILVYKFGTDGNFTPYLMENISASIAIDRSNLIVLHPQAAFDSSGSRLITMIDERDPVTLQPARTIAFDVFDFGVQQLEGSDPRVYETISYASPDEVKWNPVAVGPYVYTVGEQSGIQSWGACGLMAGKIELASVTQLSCNGAEIHGWVTGAQKISNVELRLDAGSLGTVPVGGIPRTDIASRTPVLTWRATVNLDQTTRGEHVLRLIATDALGNRRQVAAQRVYFPGPGQNCMARRRSTGGRF